jgi:hypothetical protein
VSFCRGLSFRQSMFFASPQKWILSRLDTRSLPGKLLTPNTHRRSCRGNILLLCRCKYCNLNRYIPFFLLRNGCISYRLGDSGYNGIRRLREKLAMALRLGHYKLGTSCISAWFHGTAYTPFGAAVIEVLFLKWI